MTDALESPAARRPAALPRSRGRRLRWPAALALALVAAAAVGWRERQAALTIAAIRTAGEVDAVVGGLRDHLLQRETLARAVGAAFQPPPDGIAPGALGRVDPRLLGYVPDLFSFVWVPRVEAGRVAEALAALGEAGVARPALLGPGRRPLAEEELVAPHFLILDILPATGRNRLSLGLDLGTLPLPSEALARAEAWGDIAATGPLELVQLPGERAMVLYVPVADRSAPAGRTIGYLGFSYRFDSLFAAAFAGADLPGPLRVLDPESPDPVLHAAGDWAGAPPPLVREVEFGGRSWRVEIAPPDPRGPALMRGVAAAGAALLALALVLAVARHLLRTRARLERALSAQIEAEERLRILVRELAHRVANAYSLAGSVASQVFRDADPDGRARDAFAARLRSLSRATALLSEDGRGDAAVVPLRGLVGALGLPFADRVALRGEDLPLAPGAAQSLGLLVHELWTNAVKHGALSTPGGRVDLSWRAEGGRFRLAWREEGGPAIERLPERRGFGRRLIERLVPAQLDGMAALAAGAGGLLYELDAPLARVLGPRAAGG